MAQKMAMDYKFGLMVQDMRVNGRGTEHSEKGNFTTQMETLLMEHGKMIKHMVMVSIYMPMGICIWVIGNTTSNMVLV